METSPRTNAHRRIPAIEVPANRSPVAASGVGRGGLAGGLDPPPARSTPTVPVVPDPIQQRPLKPDIMPHLLGLDPLVTQNLLTLSQKLLVEAGVLHKIVRRPLGGCHGCGCRYAHGIRG